MKNKWIGLCWFFCVALWSIFRCMYLLTDRYFSESSLPVINNNIQSFSFVPIKMGKTITERDVDSKVYVSRIFFYHLQRHLP